MNARPDTLNFTRPERSEGLVGALAACRKHYEESNPKSRTAFESAKTSLPGGNTRSVLFYSPFPVVIAKAQGAEIEDIDGHRYQDFLGEYTAGLYGHSHPVLMQALKGALEGGLTLGGPTLLEANYAALIRDRFPAIERLRFCNSGTEANVLALSVARAFTGRTDIMVIDGSYHGGVLSFAGEHPLNLPFPTHRIRFNDPDRAREAILEKGAHLAAVVVEPMIGAGGCIPAEAGFLKTLRDATAQTGALLVFDEVMTSRHGRSGLHGKFGIHPDLVTLGKYLGGGLSFGAFGGRADILDRFDPTKPSPWAHAGTFNNNILSMTAGYTGLRDVFTPSVAEAFFDEGEIFRSQLIDTIEPLGLPIKVTGLGSMMALHFGSKTPVAPYSPSGHAQQLYELVHLRMMSLGQFYARRGMINLSLPVSEEMKLSFCAALKETLAECGSIISELVDP